MAKKKVKSKKRAVGKAKYTAAKSKAVKKKTRPAKTVSKAKVAKKAPPIAPKKAKAKVALKSKTAPKKAAKRKPSKPQSVAPVPTPAVADPPETLDHDPIVEPTVTSNVETSTA